MRPIYNDELYHYGKLGMKWGHTKATQIKKFVGGAESNIKKKESATPKLKINKQDAAKNTLKVLAHMGAMSTAYGILSDRTDFSIPTKIVMSSLAGSMGSTVVDNIYK